MSELKTHPLWSPYTTFVVNLLDVPHQHYHGEALYVRYDDVAKLLYAVMPNTINRKEDDDRQDSID